MLPQRTLNKWRKESLNELKYIRTKAIDPAGIRKEEEFQKRILRMTQELLDSHLTREK